MKYKFISMRTQDQAKGMHMGKESDFYKKVTSILEMNAEDIETEGFEEGETITITSEAGETQVTIKKADGPKGIVFMAMGTTANAITPTETGGTGMPPYKAFNVELKKAGK